MQVEVTASYASSWLPLAGQLTGLSFDYRDGRAQRADVRYNPATTTAMVRGALVGNDDYTFSAVLPDERLRSSMTPYPHRGRLQPAGAFLDPLLRPWAQADLSPVGKVLSLARYLKTNGRYTDGGEGAAAAYGPGHDIARLGKGFFGSRRPVGNDEQYAAFVALAANRLGVPARVVIGARPGPRGWVRGRDVFAWVELRVGDGSWRVLPLSAFMSHREPRRSEPPRTSPERYVERTTPRATGQPTQRPGTARTRRDDGITRGPAGAAVVAARALGRVGGARTEVAATPTTPPAPAGLAALRRWLVGAPRPRRGPGASGAVRAATGRAGAVAGPGRGPGAVRRRARVRSRGAGQRGR